MTLVGLTIVDEESNCQDYVRSLEGMTGKIVFRNPHLDNTSKGCFYWFYINKYDLKSP